MNSILNILLQLIFILVLVAFNAFFAASEMAIISLNNSKVEKMAEEGDKKAQNLVRLVKEPSKFLATIQIGITLAGFLASASASKSFSDIISTWITGIGLPVSKGIANAISVVLVVGALTYITLVLGELVPKRLALQKSEKISLSVSKPLILLSKISSPFVTLLSGSTNSLVKLFGGTPGENEEKITEEEIRIMLDVGEERGVIREVEKEMIENIFDFDDVPISRVMTNRMDIVSLPIESTLEEIVKTVDKERFSRIPVYENTIDNIIGILHSKDLIGILMDCDNREFNLKEIIRPPYFVHGSKKTDELFKELQIIKNHIAIVIDDFGGTDGLVTMEDLIEEIVGNIFDEDDEIIREIEKVDENTYILNGSVRLEDVEEYFDLKMPVDDYETLSGFIIGQLGHIPEESEKCTVEFNGLMFKVLKIENKTVSKVKACKI